MITIPSKLPQVGTTIFTVMSQLANTHQAINLSQGFPDFDCDPALTELLGQYAQRGFNQYSPMMGQQSLREQIAEKYQKIYQSVYHPDTEITVTSGGSEAIFSVIAAVVGKGDEVIVFEPAYDLYQPTVQLFGGVVKSIVLEPPYFKIDWQQVKDQISEKTKLIIINNPNNPSTQVFSKEDLQELQDLVKDTSILILSDEVYEHIVFDDIPFQSVSLYPDLKERSFIVASFGKLLHLTGWKIGYCVAPEQLMKEFRKTHQFNVFCVHTPSQLAIADYLANNDVYSALSGFFQQKRDRFVNGMKGTEFELIPSQGSYFINASYQKISEESDMDFAQRMTIEYGVASIPVSAFYTDKDPKLLRFCFAKKDETIDKALELLQKVKS